MNANQEGHAYAVTKTPGVEEAQWHVQDQSNRDGLNLINKHGVNWLQGQVVVHVFIVKVKRRWGGKQTFNKQSRLYPAKMMYAQNMQYYNEKGETQEPYYKCKSNGNIENNVQRE